MKNNLCQIGCVLLASLFGFVANAEPWRRHVIDDSYRGADGVRLADFNGDGLPDIVTGWEESGVVRLYLHPGYDAVAGVWPAVTVGKASSPEDALPIDLDGDQRLEIISCHEGKQRQVLVHRNIVGSSDEALLDRTSWTTERIKSLNGQMWMYAEPIRLRGSKQGFVVGSKNANASVTLLKPPDEHQKRLDRWEATPLRPAGWIMSIDCLDMDGDGDDDIVFNDRKGTRRGIAWLEQPDVDSQQTWKQHPIGANHHETLFIDASRDHVLASTRSSLWIDLQRHPDDRWTETSHANPIDVPFGKAIRRMREGSLVMTANTAAAPVKQSVPGVWIQPPSESWQPIDTTTSTKFDRIELVDLDGDGDEDVLTCEERRNLGIIWYENPSNP